MQPIRVLHVLNSLNRGGAETMLMNYYRVIDKSKVQFDFVVHTNPPGIYATEIKNMGGRVFYVPKFHGWNILACIIAWQRIFKIAKEDRIVQGHMPSTAGLYLLLARIYGRYAIVHAHSNDAHNEDSGLKRLIRTGLYALTCHVAQQFYGCSKLAGLARYGQVIVSGQRFAVWHNAIDYSRFRFDKIWRGKIRKQLQIPAEAIVLGHVGRLTFAKNHCFLLQLFAAFYKQQADAHLILVGDGELRQQLEAQAATLGIKDAVHFIGDVDDPEHYLSAMDVFVFPSHYEGLPTVNIEAQVNGLPCIVSPAVPMEVNVSAKGRMRWVAHNDSKAWLKSIKTALQEPRQAGVVTNTAYDIIYAADWALGEYERIMNRIGKG